MAQVTRQASVSVITVSRALRQSDQVSEETKRQAEVAMDELGYVPNHIAGGLAAIRTCTRIVAAIVPFIRHGGLWSRCAAGPDRYPREQWVLCSARQ
jgi:LacI family gluconate utilization system Gnt-I transcriptional repressor